MSLIYFLCTAFPPHLGLQAVILESQACFSNWQVAGALSSGARPTEQLLEDDEQKAARHQHLQARLLIYIHNALFFPLNPCSQYKRATGQSKSSHFRQFFVLLQTKNVVDIYLVFEVNCVKCAFHSYLLQTVSPVIFPLLMLFHASVLYHTSEG